MLPSVEVVAIGKPRCNQAVHRVRQRFETARRDRVRAGRCGGHLRGRVAAAAAAAALRLFLSWHDHRVGGRRDGSPRGKGCVVRGGDERWDAVVVVWGGWVEDMMTGKEGQEVDGPLFFFPSQRNTHAPKGRPQTQQQGHAGSFRTSSLRTWFLFVVFSCPTFSFSKARTSRIRLQLAEFLCDVHTQVSKGLGGHGQVLGGTALLPVGSSSGCGGWVGMGKGPPRRMGWLE